MPFLESEAGEPPNTPLTDTVYPRRWLFFAGLIVIYAMAFNGQWRMGRDSALYRGLGHALATGQGYQFGEFGSRQIYPGLPVLLAGLEKVFGSNALPAILLIHLFSLGVLFFTYKLVRLHFGQWLAVVVTFCVGMNGWFVELTNEIRDDIPFLLGMMMALYGWERLRIALGQQGNRAGDAHGTTASPPSRGIGGSITLLLVGLLVAAFMRPTFWILAIAWVIVCVAGLIVGPRRKFHALCLGMLLVAWITMALADPRVRGFQPLAGGYERDARAAMMNVAVALRQNIPTMLGGEFSYAFFGTKWFPGMTELLSLIAIGASLLLLRRNPLWTLLVLLTVAVTLVMTTVPRYYIMILPLLMLGWMLLSCAIACRVPHRWLDVTLIAGFALLVLPNLAWCIKVVGQQRNIGDYGGTSRRQSVVDMSKRIQELVPPGEKVIAPDASIMRYLSGRDVVMHRDVLPENKKGILLPAHLAALNIRYTVFPSRLYDGSERRIRELMDKGVIVPVDRVAKEDEMTLWRVEVHVPPEGQDWRMQAVTTAPITAKTTPGGTTRPSAAKLAKKRRQAIAGRRAAAERKALAEARQRKIDQQTHRAAVVRAAAKKRKLERAATTQSAPATQPRTTTQPTTKLLGTGWDETAYFFDVGGFFGQSVASRRLSICFRVNDLDPASIPWQCFPADSQFWRLSSTPSQNGQVRHCSGRTA